MEKMKKSILLIIGLFIIVVGLFYFFNKDIAKSAFIDLDKVYQEFAMKKEMEAKLQQTVSARKKITDSLELNLKLLSSKIEQTKGKDKKLIEVFHERRQEYLIKKKTFDEDNSNLSEQYNDQVIKQMNQYVRDFGKTKKYDFIYGANGNGAIMYADE